MTVSSRLEVGVVLLAGASSIGVESGTVDVVEGGEVKERRIPAVTCQARVEPVFGT